MDGEKRLKNFNKKKWCISAGGDLKVWVKRDEGGGRLHPNECRKCAIWRRKDIISKFSFLSYSSIS